MTYCLGIKLNKHIVLMSDSRTSAGVDNISTYSKMWRFGVPGERQFVLCSAGNLATTQAVVTALQEDIEKNATLNLTNINNLNEGAEYIGKVNVAAQKKNTGGGPMFESTFLFGGEILGSEPALHMIYSQGNHITSSSQAPFLQIGEFKYGKPILDRVVQEDMPIDRAVLTALVSMDATTKSNVTVGPPIELCVLDTGSLQPGRYLSLEADNDYMRELRNTWGKLMEQAMDQIQSPNWMGTTT